MSFVAILGIPSAGKTTLCDALAMRVGGLSFCEPDRDAWPEFISEGYQEHAFEVLQWFRCHQLDAIRQSVEVGRANYSICDAYYHKILYDYIDAETSEWIIERTSPYFEVFREICRLDKIHIPNADFLIFVRTTRANWTELVRTRNSIADEIVLEYAYPTQERMLDATANLSSSAGVPLLVVDQEVGGLQKIVEQCRLFIGATMYK